MYELLSQTRIQNIVPEIALVQQMNKEFRWIGEGVDQDGKKATARIPMKPAVWGEISLRTSDRFTIVPVIGRNQRAPMKTPNATARVEHDNIPVIKHGMNIPLDLLKVLQRVEESLSGAYATNAEDKAVWTNWEGNQLKNLIYGIYAQMEVMAVGMLLNNYSYANREGFQFNASWQAPSYTMVTTSTPWGNGTPGIANATAGATPIDDIQLLRTQLQTVNGKLYNRITMSTQAFDYFVGTTQFRNLAPLFWSRAGVIAPTANLAGMYSNRGLMKPIVEGIFDMEIEFDDRQYMVESNDGQNYVVPPNIPNLSTGLYQRYLPVNKVILTNSNDDGNIGAWNIANLPVTESEPGMVPAMIGSSTGSQVGPFAYAAATSMTGDPPGKALYAVAEAFPRKWDLLSSAVLTVF